MPTKPRVAVLGAGGHTGCFVADLLARKDVIPIPASRSGRLSPTAGGDLTCVAFDFTQPSSLDRVLADADAVINCAGPFFDTAEPAAEAALRARIPYLDVTAEQMTALRLFECFDERAGSAGITVMPSMAFFGGLADLLVSALATGQTRLESIDIAVGLDSWRPTRGTRLTGQRNTFTRLIVRDGRLVPVPTPPPARQWLFPEPLGAQLVTCIALTEVILISRHIRVDSITSFMNQQPLKDLHDARTPPPPPVDDRGRSAQQFIMDVRVTGGGRHLRAIARGRDIYAVTAPLVVNACLELLKQGPVRPGVRTPGHVFEPRSFLAGLAPDIAVEFSD